MNTRLLFLVGLAASWLLAAGFRLYDLQVRRFDELKERADRQQQRVVDLDPPRGTIYDARGRELSVSVEVDSVYADPTRLEDPAAASARLAEALGANRARLRKSLEGPGEFVWVKRKLDPPVAEKVRQLELPGVGFVSESKRYYPMRELASQVLGFVGTDNRGLGGLEALFDQRAAGQPGQRRVVRDARYGTVLYPHMELAAARPGDDIELTLDAAIQHVVERELAAAVERHGARRGTVVLLDPASGAVLAMASYPSFDPNRFNDFPESRWRNPAIMDAYEPGSTFKMVTLAAALEHGGLSLAHELECQMGGISLGRSYIRDHKPFGRLSVREVIAKSSNVGAIKLGKAAGPEALHRMVDAFGFGRPTGIDLPGENGGILRPLERLSELSLANIAFGQAISVTPLQLVNAFAAIGNGGVLHTPYVVTSIGGETPPRDPSRRLPLSRTTIEAVRSALEEVTVEGGTGRRAAVEGFRVAGKTGTAQKPIPGRGYVDGKYIASFVGFAPAENPAVAAVVVIDEPWPRYHGGEAAAPVFGAIVSEVLLYLGVRPGRAPLEAWPGQPSEPLPVRLAQHREPPTAAPGTVPDLTGLSARQALRHGHQAGLRLALNGHGFVSRQMPAPGSSLDAAAGTVELWLAPEAMGS